MADAGLFVHKSARDAHEQITRLWDFMSPTIVAMWNLRWQVQGFLKVKPDATQDELKQRFALGSEIRGNEIKRACVDNSWDEQKNRFASILLTNSIAIFEEFLDGLVGLNLSGEKKTKTVKALQFPVQGGGRNYLQGYTAMGSTVPELVGAFSSGAALGKWYSKAKLQNLLLCYRVFKEIRNASVHAGGRATPEVMAAHAEFLPVATASALGVKEAPKYPAPMLNQVMTVDYRGVSMFSDVILRLIATYDRDFSDRRGALDDISNRLGKVPSLWRGRTVNAKKKQKIVDGLMHNAGMPVPNYTQGFMTWLKQTDRMPAGW